MSKMYFKRDIFFKDFPVDYVDLKLLSIFNPLTRPCLMIGMSFIRVVGLALAAYFILLHHSFVTLGFQCEKNILSFMACVKNLCAPEFSGVLARLIKVKEQ